MRSKSEIEALERVFGAAERMRTIWRGAYHGDHYIRAVTAVANEVDAAEVAIAKARATPRRAKPAKKRLHR